MNTNNMTQTINYTYQSKSTTAFHLLIAKIIKTMKSTCKADKYIRLVANIVKLIRTATA
jgi:hypothetical protein